jgi:hypothetical protein
LNMTIYGCVQLPKTDKAGAHTWLSNTLSKTLCSLHRQLSKTLSNALCSLTPRQHFLGRYTPCKAEASS